MSSESAPPIGPPPAPHIANGRWYQAGLSTRLLLLTILFVLLAEVLIFLPSVTNFRNNWLIERLSQARAVALILEKTPPDTLPRPIIEELLAGMETTTIALRIDNARQLLAISDMPPMVDFDIDLRGMDFMAQIASAFDTLAFGEARTIRVVGTAPRGGDFVEIVINEKPLRAAMAQFSWTILQISLIISGITALLVFGALNWLIVRPVKELAQSVSVFRQAPESIRSIHQPSRRNDELGALERNIAEMQLGLQQELRQREHLANLGLAVAKVNHDLRNMLGTAQLLADRLGSLPDPNVQRVVPKLLEALDRAINFCQSTLAYGKAQERPARLAPINLKALMQDVADQLMLSPTTMPMLGMTIPEGLAVLADMEHLNRVLTNLLRNARAALEAMPDNDRAPMIHVLARRTNGLVEIIVEDNGPGIPENVQGRLFRAFSGSSRPGGTGLGLAIAHELMRSMGGSIELVASLQTPPLRGTRFRLVLPRGV